jgi:hypothetical protein
MLAIACRRVTQLLRKVCLALMVAGVGSYPANACSIAGPPPTIEDHFARAATVFIARIIRTEEAQIVWSGQTEPIVEATFRPIEVLKGELAKVRSPTFGPGNCTIPLVAGWTYVFFLHPGDGHHTVLWPSGSFPAPNLEAKASRRIWKSCVSYPPAGTNRKTSG